MKKYSYDKIGEEVYIDTLDNGLTVYYVLKPEFNKVNAMFTTKYGSIHNDFNINNQHVKVPDGIAHFLEHKMFEKADCDMMEIFSKSGANTNAFTSFDRTAYYFTSTTNFEDNLKHLIKMVTQPYFTTETVEKEKGIISEEIKMYEDDASWVLYFGMLNNLFATHPLKIDIAGTCESISEISASDLHLCFDTFYHPSNCSLVIVGNFDLKKTATLVKTNFITNIKKSDLSINHTIDINKPTPVANIELDINVNKTAIGFKANQVIDYSFKNETAVNIYLEALFAKSSANYALLSKDNYYPSYFYQEIDNTAVMFISSDVVDDNDFVDKITTILAEDVSDIDLDRLRKKTVGELIKSFNSIEGISRNVVDAFMNDFTLDDMINDITTLTNDEIRSSFKKMYNLEYMSIVNVRGKND